MRGFDSQVRRLGDWRLGEGKQLPVLQPGRSPGQPPIFQRVGIVGLGLIGGSIALAARQIWPDGLVIGVDRKDVLERAMVLHAIDVAADDLVVLAEADLVILAAPIQRNLDILRELPDNVAGSAVVTDTGSTKREIVEAATALPDRLTFIGGHPLGGAARGGIEHARADMFTGRPWLFTPTRKHDMQALDKLKSFATGLGAVPRTLSPDDHDRLLAFISHLPQLTVSALMHVVGQAAGPDDLSLSGRGLQDTTRLASSPADIWKDVCATNADEIGAALDALMAVLQQLRADLETGKSIDEVFESANRWRETLLSDKS
ncbi:MAG: prephenate dehydrogenase/arogenate dehydrogenase family protein [Acidobacteria bacterium]|nr:MAG: prephenate dehydrogenase/arogenate dehydrogenase family protein [Acidobacteriota bacterium]